MSRASNAEATSAGRCASTRTGSGTASFGGQTTTAPEFEVFSWSLGSDGETQGFTLLDDWKGYAHGAAANAAGDVFLAGELQPSEFAPNPEVDPGIMVMRQDLVAAKLTR